MYQSIQEKAVNRVTRRWVEAKTKLYFSCPVIEDHSGRLILFSYSPPGGISYPRGEKKFRNILPGLLKRLKKTEKASGFLGDFTISGWFAKEYLHLEPGLVKEKSLNELKRIAEWNMFV
jgi:hypothetical protein